MKREGEEMEINEKAELKTTTTKACDAKLPRKVRKFVPKRRLAECIALGLELVHDERPFGDCHLGVLEESNEDVLVDLGVPLHDLAAHDVTVEVVLVRDDKRQDEFG